jgi:hypothetical protein
MATTIEPFVPLLNSKLGLQWSAQEYTMIFFLVSKSEHDNMDPEKTFLCADGNNVFTYAEALEYDWTERGVTLGICGFTSANSGNSKYGDAEKVFHRFYELGGPDLLPIALRCHKDKAAANHLCKTIQKFTTNETFLFTKAQLDIITNPKGYLYEAVKSIRQLDVPVKPLLVSALFDTLLNFGIGGRYCPLAWMQKRGKRNSKTKTLRRLLRWKRKVGCKNHHNSCKHNGQARSDMFKQLLKKKQWDLQDIDTLRKVVQWRMK